MASFAERMGHRAVRTLVQSDDLDVETRTELWNVIVAMKELLYKKYKESSYRDSTAEQLTGAIWAWEFKRARDEMESQAVVWAAMKKRIMSGEWFDVLNLIEETAKHLESYQTNYTKGLSLAIRDGFNNRFEHYLVGYRFIGDEITPIDSTAEAEAVVGATEDASSIAGARHHLQKATEHLADRQNPDYPNSIKESISAVEAVVKKVTGEGQLGAGLNKLEAVGLTIHPALKAAWSKMYGWTSDEDGIRHGGIEAADADQALAKYMLVTCSAFVSYLIEEGRKASLL